MRAFGWDKSSMPRTRSLSALCTCDTIYRLAQEPDVPIIFDQTTNEFHFVFGAEGRSRALMYHCFFCGGALPKSQRDQLFAILTQAETRRLRSLTKSLRTIEQVVSKLGQPDHDLSDGESLLSPGSATEPDHVRTFRTLIYSRLSSTADVRIVEYAPCSLGVELVGKYIGMET